MKLHHCCILLAATALLGGCATATSLTCPTGQTVMTSESLYFGTATPEGTVSAADWQGFLDQTVTPRFPDGLSVWPASGQWQTGKGQLVREDSYVLTIVHPDDDTADHALDEIVTAYKSAFQQEAVLRVRGPVCVSF